MLRDPPELVVTVRGRAALAMGTSLAVAALAGCPTAHTLQPARALGTGRAQVSAELGAQLHPLDREIPAQPLQPEPPWSGAGAFETLGTADLTLRYGLGPRTDGFGRAGSSGMEAGLKQELFRSSWFAVGVLGSARSRLDLAADPEFGADDVQQMLDGTGALLLEVRAGIASVVLAPKAVMSLHFGCGNVGCSRENLYPFFDYGATLGVQLRLGSVVVMPEVAALRSMRERGWVDENRPAITGTISLGWTGDAARDAL